ncbi:Hypothetical Protein FCC1311_021342 [Hondaea fermentalgiana]|uniref:PUB domain-containing protein n=1 Tax=Hondaea fermentalgiana TaxID=2315210 RepID=A0A2R5G5V1_9STRA|nr:Hypothetical Protein FCC1311_021342 [Hondaea fermentalgiana]|eukprot:GBG25915.1 Hypothetical Protein FCC1311_021342 [Hondaea fermentalgiana]
MREKREKDQRAADAQIGRSISGGGTAANSERESLAGIDQDGAVSKEMQAQAKELERSGFNPYESTMHSAAAGRTAANLQGLQGPSEDSASAASADSTPSPEKIMQQAGQALEAAINAADLTQLERAIHFARNAVSSGSVDSDKVDPDVISKYEQAVALYDALVESVKQTEEVPDAPDGPSKSTLSSTPQASEDHDFLLQTAAASLTEAMGELESAATLDREATLKTLRSLIKVVDNAKQKPEEAKFRKLRLANPAIRNMFVDFAAGAPLGVLKAVGFQESQETAANGESEERVLVLPSSHNGVFEARYEPTRSVLSELLAQFENA